MKEKGAGENSLPLYNYPFSGAREEWHLHSPLPVLQCSHWQFLPQEQPFSPALHLHSPFPVLQCSHWQF
jgi:hypothetical protein